jgi:hypothetical protein
MWALDQSDAERALPTVVGLDRFWIFSVPPTAVRLAWMDAALNLPWAPSSVNGIRARGRAYQTSAYSTVELTQLPPRAWRSRDACFSKRSPTRQA